ncbi:hypothetical protein HXX76_005471 [Chlamydomonas incerta]|uniref:Uncharacterized protein n=1 Tax=Chlamydomonas incerta TaxID=51695 RepID=A0A835T7S0_CHLIN|nr:hypothetical protein HXX76_005471 [Chlamydomonas incerta]|eukprot:KAG2437853.1 hypothetical protein HXX76_005471 [Chlamydomonas incerta]
MDTKQKYLIISYVTCIFAQVMFALYALVRCTIYLRRQHHDQTAEQFITGRGTAGRWRIAWSFFASAVGAWCITAPPSFAVYTGIVGLVMYAFASGLPIIFIALFGARIQEKHPDVCTMPDFRYGPVARTTCVVISLINMAIVLLAEYTTIGILFKYFVGSVDYPIVIVVGVLTMFYTAYGGVYISIVTDQAQGIMTSLFILILIIYTAITYRPEYLPKPLPNDITYETGWPLGANKLGYSAIFSMPCSLVAATVFSEAMWQKVWASTDRKSVVFGGFVGFGLTMFAVFIFGFGGWLAAWAGYVTWDTNPNLFLFQLFADERDSASPGASVTVQSWIGVVTLILATTMNEAAVDSLQNGITSVLAYHFFKGQHTIFPRIIVVLINIPLIIISLQGFQVLALFLITNMLTTCMFLLIGLGLSERLKGFVTETSVIVGFCTAMLTVTAYGIGKHWDPTDTALSIRYGAWYTWYGNVSYDWDYFLVGACFSLVGMLLWAIPAWLLRRFAGVHGPGISGVLRRLPGFRVITGDGFTFDLLSSPRLAGFCRLIRYTPQKGPINQAVTSSNSSDSPRNPNSIDDIAAAEAEAAAAKLGDVDAKGDTAYTAMSS